MKVKLALLAALFIVEPCHAQDPADNIRPAALAFSESHPITRDTYVLQAKSYLIVENGLLDELPQSIREEVRIRAREFSSFTAGLFSTYSAEETLACLSWQSIGDVVGKHAQLATTSDVEYPILTALVNLKFACLTKQEANRISESVKKKRAAAENEEQPE